MFGRIGYFYLLVLALAAGSGRAQSMPPTAPPAAAAPSHSKPAQSAPEPVATLKANAQLVVVDVVVTDKRGKSVHGMKATDFSLKEDNAQQVIKNFEEHAALTLADATKFAPMPKLPPGIFSDFMPAPANGAVNLVLLDSLNTPMDAQAYVRQQVLAYLKSTPPGTRTAIFGLTTRLLVLQGFSSDPEVLKSFLARGFGKGSPLLNNQAGGGGVGNAAADELEEREAHADIVSNLRQFDAQQQSFDLQLRAEYTLAAMRQIARYLAIIPGRKNLIWFSGSFPINILTDTTSASLYDASASSGYEFRETLDLLARSRVAVYPIDALTTSTAFEAANERNYGGSMGITRMTQDENKYLSDTAGEHATMQAMATATGGNAFVNSTGLTASVSSAIDEGSNFYTLTYTPTNSERDGRFRKIKIQLARQGVTLSYRQGYYADDPGRIKSPLELTDAAVTTGSAPSTNDTMRIAMTRGAPTPSEILIKVGIVPINSANEPEDNPAEGNTLAPKTRGPYRRYSVNYAIEPTDLSFVRASDGKVHADFELMIVAFDPTGVVVNSTDSTVHIAGTLDEIKALVTRAIFYHAEISTPVKGKYFLRIGVRDLLRDRYGAVEVATSEVRNVVPSAASLPTPATQTKK